jgi:hypothetical protein
MTGPPMKTFSQLKQRIDEEREPTVYTVTAFDPDHTLQRLLDCIKSVGNTGHSFAIVVDPDAKEGLEDRKFYWDGDGADSIKSIE